MRLQPAQAVVYLGRLGTIQGAKSVAVIGFTALAVAFCQTKDKERPPVSRRHQQVFIAIGHELLGCLRNVIRGQAFGFGIFHPSASDSPLHSLPLRLLYREDLTRPTLLSDLVVAPATNIPPPRRRHGPYPSSQARARDHVLATASP